MTIKEIEEYLALKNTSLDEEVYEAIEKHRIRAIGEEDEDIANYCWCIKQIYVIQKNYLSVFNSLKKGKYEDAWHYLERTGIELSFLKPNFHTATSLEADIYHLFFIEKAISHYEKLFPYFIFTSREDVIKKEKCSICGQTVKIRNGCNHVTGRLYMGEMCSRIVEDFEILGFALVKDPFDKYAVVKPEGKEYNYKMLEILIEHLESPYDMWYVDETTVIKQEYKNIGRNDRCPCGSGRKYKKCCIDTKNIYTTHYRINLLNQPARMINDVTYVGTWKE